jgi:hypothetical protein
MSSERRPKNGENATNWRIASKSYYWIPPLHATADLDSVLLNDVSADPALCWDTLPLPLGFKG